MNALSSVGHVLSARQPWARTLVVGLLLAAVMLGSVASVAAKRSHVEHYITHITSFVSTQKDPNVVAPGDEFILGGTFLRFASPHEQLGTFGFRCVATAADGSRLLCSGSAILPGGKITIEMLLVQPDEPLRYSAITGGTGIYRGASGQQVNQTLSNGDEVATLYFDD